MTSHNLSVGRSHPDELRPVECRLQTQHKLELMRVYPAQCASILAESERKKRLGLRHICFVDLFAGAGLHLSANHPDGEVAGTALLAARAARRVARKYSEIDLHVRLVEIDDAYCAKLVDRTKIFREQGYDVRVVPGSYDQRTGTLIHESLAMTGRSFTLWFFDPFGIKVLDRRIFEPVEAQGLGHEMLINLDVGGLFRLRAAAGHFEADSEVLDLTFGNRTWESAYGAARGQWGPTEFEALAKAYAKTFERQNVYTAVYPLRSSGNQIRYFIHVARHPTAIKAFAKTHRASQNIQLYQGAALTPTEKAHLVERLFPQVHGERLTVDEMHDAQLLPLSKSQLRTVLREADDLGYGVFDEKGGVIAWYDRRDHVTGIGRRPPADSGQQVELFGS
jgi:three-Cys-motif partner protein